jgi:CRISPR-associated protein Csm1
MADMADGRKLLGFFKADVDNLGRMLAFGLKRQSHSLDTISRQTTFSRLMDSFFTGYINSLVTSEYPECYTVYSGGDDLFFVGPWDKVLSLAEQINQDFRKFAGNTGLTLSAGLNFARANYPVARAAEMADQALDTAKEKGRNRLTLLGTTLTWEEWSEVKNEWYYLQNLLDTHPAASAFGYNLLKMALMWKRYRSGDTRGLRYHPLLAYNIKRNLDERRLPELNKWARRLLTWPPDEHTSKILDHLDIIVTLCLYGIRGRE